MIRQFKLPGEEEDTVHECRCGSCNSRAIRHPELSRSKQESIMVDECRCGGSNSRVMRHSELSISAQHTEETRKIHHKNTSTESVTENDADVGLEQRLRLIRQSDRSENEQSSNEVEEMSHVCRCGGINSRVMRHPELNDI